MNRTEVFIHPVRLRILQYLSIHQSATTSEILDQLTGVSKASMYNNIKLLEQNEAIEVIKENQIRGTIEKTYALKKIKNDNDFNAILTFLLTLLQEFQQYYEKDGNPAEDMLFAGRDYLMLNDAEYREFIQEYEELCRRYFGRNSEGAKLRNISIISSPTASGE